MVLGAAALTKGASAGAGLTAGMRRCCTRLLGEEGGAGAPVAAEPALLQGACPYREAGCCPLASLLLGMGAWYPATAPKIAHIVLIKSAAGPSPLLHTHLVTSAREVKVVDGWHAGRREERRAGLGGASGQGGTQPLMMIGLARL